MPNKTHQKCDACAGEKNQLSVPPKARICSASALLNDSKCCLTNSGRLWKSSSALLSLEMTPLI